ncbi:MAG TPA: 3-phosphoshikimate 1-carboxyvinyltransferase [Acidimicrobiales bacterium]|jgi:3-phosphoshikimate 1-carboxyvinyltransferase|nr:3-phosphoshikimate 1-carboxyvinyltransferase [Acidimicrobiales bacterium]
MSDALSIEPLSRPPDTTIEVPGSKSITNRALVCAALANGNSVLEGTLAADDTEAMIDCLRALGIEIDVVGDTVTVHGRGGDIPATDAHLDVRLSGTTARFIVPLLARGHGRYEVDAAAPMRRRPMAPVFDALRSLGVGVHERGVPGFLPVVIESPGVRGGHVATSGDVSSQFVSGLMMAGFTVDVTTDLVSQPYVEMTGAVMRAFAEPRTFAIEPDASAASYFFAAAVLLDGRVTVEGLGSSSLQGDARFVEVLEAMGATVERDARRTTVRGAGVIQGIDIDLRHLSDMVPTLAAVAVFADSPTTIRGVGFIRGKESNRIAAVVTELQRCGIDAVELDDGLTIAPGSPRPARIRTYNDHRLAMAFALVGLRVPGIEIRDPACVAKTFPGYFEALDQLR